MRRIRTVAFAAGTAAFALTTALAAPALGAPAGHRPGGGPKPPPMTEKVVVSGLNSPKHLTFGPGGLYVTQSGTGGASCFTDVGPAGPPPTQFCAGATGSVSILNRFGLHTVLGNLASVTEQDSGETLGPAAVTFVDGRLGVLFQNEFVNPDGTNRAPAPAAEQFGKLLVSHRHGNGSTTLQPIADITKFSAEHPQGSDSLGTLPEPPYDSDPYDIVPYRGGYAIADAAANSILWLHHGQLSMIARLPSFPEGLVAQAVPTSLAVGPDGALYVGILRGVPSVPGTAFVYKVVPGHAPTVVVDGLSAVTDIAFDSHGRLLVLEFNTGGLLGPEGPHGALVRATLGCKGAPATVEPIALTTPLMNPTGLAYTRDGGGTAYIANNGTSAGTGTPSGEIVRVTGLG